MMETKQVGINIAHQLFASRILYALKLKLQQKHENYDSIDLENYLFDEIEYEKYNSIFENTIFYIWNKDSYIGAIRFNNNEIIQMEADGPISAHPIVGMRDDAYMNVKVLINDTDAIKNMAKTVANFENLTEENLEKLKYTNELLIKELNDSTYAIVAKAADSDLDIAYASGDIIAIAKAEINSRYVQFITTIRNWLSEIGIEPTNELGVFVFVVLGLFAVLPAIKLVFKVFAKILNVFKKESYNLLLENNIGYEFSFTEFMKSVGDKVKNVLANAVNIIAKTLKLSAGVVKIIIYTIYYLITGQIDKVKKLVSMLFNPRFYKLTWLRLNKQKDTKTNTQTNNESLQKTVETIINKAAENTATVEKANEQTANIESAVENIKELKESTAEVQANIINKQTTRKQREKTHLTIIKSAHTKQQKLINQLNVYLNDVLEKLDSVGKVSNKTEAQAFINSIITGLTNIAKKRFTEIQEKLNSLISEGKISPQDAKVYIETVLKVYNDIFIKQITQKLKTIKQIINNNPENVTADAISKELSPIFKEAYAYVKNHINTAPNSEILEILANKLLFIIKNTIEAISSTFYKILDTNVKVNENPINNNNNINKPSNNITNTINNDNDINVETLASKLQDIAYYKFFKADRSIRDIMNTNKKLFLTYGKNKAEYEKVIRDLQQLYAGTVYDLGNELVIQTLPKLIIKLYSEGKISKAEYYTFTDKLTAIFEAYEKNVLTPISKNLPTIATIDELLKFNETVITNENKLKQIYKGYYKYMYDFILSTLKESGYKQVRELLIDGFKKLIDTLYKIHIRLIGKLSQLRKEYKANMQKEQYLGLDDFELDDLLFDI